MDWTFPLWKEWELCVSPVDSHWACIDPLGLCFISLELCHHLSENTSVQHLYSTLSSITPVCRQRILFSGCPAMHMAQSCGCHLSPALYRKYFKFATNTHLDSRLKRSDSRNQIRTLHMAEMSLESSFVLKLTVLFLLPYYVCVSLTPYRWKLAWL